MTTRTGVSCLATLLVMGCFLAALPPLKAQDDPAADSAPAQVEPIAEGEPAADAGQEPPPGMDDIVVTGNRSEVGAFAADRSVSVLGGEDLKEQAPRSVPTALEEAAGVFVQHTNFGGGSPIIRGQVGPQVLLLVDGVRLNNSIYRTGPLQYLNMMDPFSIERIEVLRGPGGTLYGSDAVGGVVQLFPIALPDYRDEDGLGYDGELALRYQSAARAPMAHGHVAMGHQGFTGLASFTFRHFGDLNGGGDLGRQPFSGYDHYSGYAAAGYRFSDGFFKDWDVKLAYLANVMDEVGRAEKLYAKGQKVAYRNDDHLAYLKFGGQFAPIHTRLDLTVSYQDFFERADTSGLRIDTGASPYDWAVTSITREEIWVKTAGFDAQFTTRVLENRLRFKYGASFYHDFVDADKYKALFNSVEHWEKSTVASYPDGSRYGTYGVFVLAEGDPLRLASGHTMTLNVGYRLHGVDGRFEDNGDLKAADFGYLGHAFMAGAQYLYKDRLNLSATYAQGFRAPNLQEEVLFGSEGDYFHVPNPDIKPETADTFEFLAHGRVWRLTLMWNAYVTMVDDLLYRELTTYDGQDTINGLPVARHINHGEALLWGTEGEVAVDIGHGFSLKGGLTYTWGDKIVVDGPDEPLSKIPPLFGTATLRYETKKDGDWNGYIETFVRGATKQDRLSSSDKKDVRIPEGGTPAWWTWNLRLGMTAHEHLRLNLVVENLLDAKYKYHASGVYAPGTSAMLSLEAMF